MHGCNVKHDISGICTLDLFWQIFRLPFSSILSQPWKICQSQLLPTHISPERELLILCKEREASHHEAYRCSWRPYLQL